MSKTMKTKDDELKDLREEVERLRNLLRRVQGGTDLVEISPGETVFLYLPRKS